MELQTVQRQSEGKPVEALYEASPENISDDNKALTVFVRRGWLAADNLWRKEYRAPHLFGLVDDENAHTARRVAKQTSDHRPL